MKAFNDLTKEEIAQILNIAMDDGEWHTPSAHDINLHHLSNRMVAYGWCNISKHNTYHDKEVWFNINANTVKIWEERFVKGKANECLHKPIHNVKKLAEILDALSFKTEPA